MLREPMAAFIYQCPLSGVKVQGWVAEAAAGDDTYEAVSCTSCGAMHFVNVTTGKVLGTGDENGDKIP